MFQLPHKVSKNQLAQALSINLAIVMILSASVFGIDYYVAPNGSDNNPGTLSQPFATLAKARDVVRTVNTSMTADINVYLRGGWYFQSATLTFDSRDNGTNGHYVIWQAYSNEYPVISGGRQITGWTLHDATKNIWKATATGLNTRQLFVNCERAVRAKKGMGLAGVCGANGMKIFDTTLQYLRNQSDIEFVWRGSLGPCAAWMERRCAAQRITRDSIIFKQPGWQHCFGDGQSWGGAVKGPVSEYENAFEFLDLPGEWYLDKSAGIVYYIQKLGENITTATVIAPVIETLIAGNGTITAPINNMWFKGITFAHATFLLPGGNEGWAEGQANYMYTPSNRRPLGNVSFQAPQNCRFERCTFKHLGGVGLDLYNGAHNNTVIGCVFTDISANCISIGSAYNPNPTDVRSRDTSNQVLNCYVHNAPVEYRGGIGIFVAYSSNTLVSHNEVAYTPYSGINIGWGWDWTSSYSQNNDVTYNRIHHTMFWLYDGGAIYSLHSMPGSDWHHNYISDYKCNGLYMDNGTCYTNAYSNVLKGVSPRVGMNTWLFINGPKSGYGSKNNNVHDNFTDFPSSNISDQPNTVTNNTDIVNNVWPAAALAIMDSAGLEPLWRGVLTMPCGCSVTPLSTAPQLHVLDAHSTSPTSVIVHFDQGVDAATASVAANYSINNNITITAATIGNNPSTVILTTSSIIENVRYTLSINNVKGSIVNSAAIAANSQIQFSGLGYGLIAYYKMDETNGTTLADASGNHNDATLTGKTLFAQGKIGGAVRLDSSNAQVLVPSTVLGAIGATNDFTTSLWFNADAIDYPIEIFNTTNGGLFFRIRGITWYVKMGTPSSVTGTLNGLGHFDCGVWRHLVLVKQSGVGSWYLDGALAIQVTTGPLPAETWILGGKSGGGAVSMKGYFDDVRVYNRALTFSEIQTLYKGYAGPTNVPVAPRRSTHLNPGQSIRSIQIFDALGKLVTTFDRQSIDNFRIITQKLSHGIYVIQIDNGANKTVQKLVLGKSVNSSMNTYYTKLHSR